MWHSGRADCGMGKALFWGEVMLRRTAILSLLLLLAACGRYAPATVTPTAIIEQPLPTATSTASPVAPPTEAESIEYAIVFEEGGFAVREALLGTSDSWFWAVPDVRIENTVQDLGFRTMLVTSCEEQIKSAEWCTETVELASSRGEKIRFDLLLENVLGGDSILKRDGEAIWSGAMNGGTCLPLFSSVRMGDEIAIAYSDYYYDDEASTFEQIGSILLTHGNTVIDIAKTYGYSTAFAPNEVQGKLAYLARKDGKWFLVFDGREVGERYDEVFNRCCCWDGPDLRPACNGEVIDFFAVRENGWYHVQAGDLSGLE